MNQINYNRYTINYLINNKRHMLQFQLLKYLKYENIIKFLLVCKNSAYICDANKTYDEFY